ncbi:MAG: START domain-containing protein [Bacteroidota bacterium]
MSIRKHFLLYSLFLLTCSTSYCQKWDLKKDQEGVKVYTRDFSGSNVQEFKGEVTVKSNLGGILKLIDSVSEYPKWMYKCSCAERLKKINQGSGYTYTVITSPWPISDQDLITYYNVTQDTNTKTVTISLVGVKDYLPAKSGKVRIPGMTGFWQLIPIAKGVTKVVYQVHCESGGILPADVVNAYITDTPYYVLLNLRALVESPQYPKFVVKNVKELY